ncbi:ribose-5-phosphate isomerase RpiA [Lichenicoccus sp.]|uniref:ribose-5-phosphate isomerase RpiA n=1 Tax=Lichenicoccus sp. TaxID=2781899 RepID=UPI003D11C800
MQPEQPQDHAKLAAGRRAIETYLQDGMRIGLGSGTTSHWFVRALGEKVKQGFDIAGVPTSTATRDLALEVGVPLLDLNDITELDFTIDGADEIDHAGRMIKGGGACLLWEKMVARASKRMVAVVDDKKVVDTLGAFPVPVEVIRFGWRSTERELRKLFTEFGYRDLRIALRGGAEEPIRTDSGHYILDCHLQRITDPDRLAPRFNEIPGVAEHGLFVGIADEMVIGHADGSGEVIRLR